MHIISWFLNEIVSQLLNKVPSRLTNTGQLLDLLTKPNIDQDCVIESLDVSSLHTNVSDNDALQALDEMLGLYEEEIETDGLGRARIMTLVKESLICNVQMVGKVFHQN